MSQASPKRLVCGPAARSIQIPIQDAALMALEILSPESLKLLLVLSPRTTIAPMQTITIIASITAYSTAVGPSSAFRKTKIRFI